MKFKIEEKEQMLRKMIEDGKKELYEKRMKEIENKKFDNPYDRLV